MLNLNWDPLEASTPGLFLEKGRQFPIFYPHETVLWNWVFTSLNVIKVCAQWIWKVFPTFIYFRVFVGLFCKIERFSFRTPTVLSRNTGQNGLNGPTEGSYFIFHTCQQSNALPARDAKQPTDPNINKGRCSQLLLPTCSWHGQPFRQTSANSANLLQIKAHPVHMPRSKFGPMFSLRSRGWDSWGHKWIAKAFRLAPPWNAKNNNSYSSNNNNRLCTGFKWGGDQVVNFSRAVVLRDNFWTASE